MKSSTNEPEVIRVSQKGQATIPKPLREKFGIETPGEVFVYEEGGRIVIEPVPTLSELHGIHAGEHEQGEVTAKVREAKEAAKRREEERADRLRPSEE
jgi:AbrB family looped-hinge helix DNA binding protein